MDFSKYIGVPYITGGRDLFGCDCWGLIRIVQREMNNLDLPSYTERYKTAEDGKAIHALIAGEIRPWTEIDAGTEKVFDCVLMREVNTASHIGIVIEPGKLLHIKSGETSKVERYRSGHLKHRLLGFYRYRAP